MWMIGGVLFGVIAALRKGTIIDRGIVGISLIFFAFPTFFIGLLLYKFVAIKWQIGPDPVVHTDRRGWRRHLARRACCCPG